MVLKVTEEVDSESRGPDFPSMTHCWSLKGQLKVWMQNATVVYVTELILLFRG